MKNIALIGKLEKIGKIMILIPAIVGIIFILSIIYSELTGKNIFIDLDSRIFNFLVWGGLLVLICVSIYEFFRVYNETSQ